MSITAPTSPPADGAAFGTPPSTASPSNFDVLADAFLGRFPSFQTELNAQKANVYANSVASYNNALQTAIDAAATASSAALAAAYAGATLWVSGTTYAIGDRRYSPIDGFVYRRLTSGAGTTDPSADAVNWTPAGVAMPIQSIAGLVQQANNGGAYVAANTTAQAAATNLCWYSSQFDQATWVKASSTVSADFTMGPNGDVTADKLVEAAATAQHTVSQAITAAANVQYTFSIEVKAFGRTSIAISLDRDSGMADYVKAKFDLTGVSGATSVASAGTGSGASATCTHLGNGFYLCTLTGTPSSTAGTTVRPMVHLNDFNTSYAGDGTSGVALQEAQLETGASASSRIPTAGASAARASNIIAPTRIIAPASPLSNSVFWAGPQNGIVTNMVDFNGSTFYGQAGVLVLDDPYTMRKFQFINSTWRFA